VQGHRPSTGEPRKPRRAAPTMSHVDWPRAGRGGPPCVPHWQDIGPPRCSAGALAELSTPHRLLAAPRHGRTSAKEKREERRGMERREEWLTTVDEPRCGRAVGATSRHGNGGSGVNEGEVGREIVGRRGREKGVGDAGTSGVDGRAGPSRQRQRWPNPSAHLRWQPSECACALGQHRGVGRGARAGPNGRGNGTRGRGVLGGRGWAVRRRWAVGRPRKGREGGLVSLLFIYLFIFLFSSFLSSSFYFEFSSSF
jgi:hypothetical protein